MNTENFEKIEQLLLTKQVEELSTDEQTFLLQFFPDISAIKAQQKLLFTTKRALKAEQIPLPGVAIHNSLRAQFIKKNKISFDELVIRTINYKVKLYQVAAMFIVFIGFYSVLTSKSTVELGNSNSLKTEFASSSIKANQDFLRMFTDSI